MRRSIVRALVVLIGIALLAGLALVLSTLLSPERLRDIAERQLARVTGHPVSVGRVEVALGVGIQLRGEQLELWPGPDGPALRVEEIGVGLDPLSLLAGNLRPRRIRLQGAEFRITEVEEDRFAAPLEPRDPETDSPHPREWVAPLIVTESFFRFLLARPYLADTLEVETSRVILELKPGEAGARPRVFSLAIAKGRLEHRRLRGDARLELAGGLYDRGGSLGSVSLDAHLDTASELELGLEFRGLDVSAVEKYVPDIKPEADLGGRARGSVALRSSEPGHAQLDVDVGFDELEARLLEESPWGPLQSDHLGVQGRLEISPQRVGVEDLRLSGGNLGLELRGEIGRPFSDAAPAELEFRFREIDVAELRALLDWLPYAPAEEFASVIEPVVSGRVQTFTARGAAPVSAWRELFEGGGSGEPVGLGAELEFSGIAVRVGDNERIEDMAGAVAWSGDRLQVSDLRGSLRGEALPILDLDFEGLSHLLAADPERRRLRIGGLPLPGIDALFDVLSGDPDDAEREHVPVSLDVEVDWLHHPVTLWPLENLRARARSRQDGLNLALDEGHWAGVPIRGQAAWKFEPERRLNVTLAASAPETDGSASRPRRRWVRGRFLVGPISSPVYRQRGAEGRFDAVAGMLHLHDLTIDLDPAGRLNGSAALDLSRAGEVPFQLSLALAGGDVDGLIRWYVPDREIASGSVDAWGSFDGRLRPGVTPFDGLSGFVEIEASNGQIRRSLPPVVAIALASRSFNPFVERESIRYQRVGSLAEFSGGRVSSRELSIEGPDMRVVASGGVDLVDGAHHTEAEVALFLFRPIDKAVGTIPLLNVLLLGEDRNLMAAYFRLDGPWEDPDPELVPLKSLTAGPGSLVAEGVPGVVGRGLRALGSVLEREPEPAQPRQGPAPAPWQETPRDS